MNEKNYIPPEAQGLPVQIGNVPDIKLSEIDNEPRALDLDLAKCLGLRRHRDIRKLIDRNKSELERFGTCATVARVVRGNPVKEYWLNEEQALLISALSDGENAAEVRHMLIKVFVAWRRGHLVSPTDSTPVGLHVLSKSDIAIIGNVVKNCTGVVIREQLAELLPQMLTSAVASIGSMVSPGAPAPMIRQGRTAGQIWNAHGFPRLRSTAWFGNRLTEMGCGIYGRGELGDNRARLFDPDKASDWIKGGGRAMVEGYVKERVGQGKLEGV